MDTENFKKSGQIHPQVSAAPDYDPPYHVTSYYRDQIRYSSHPQQLSRIVEPSAQESQDTGEWDTSGEHADTVMPGLQHKYPETALLMVTPQCFAYCRFCFRKRLLGKDSAEIANDYQAITRYLQQHHEVDNVLLSGGDPLVLSAEQLQGIIEPLLALPHLTAVRFGTRALAFCPERLQDENLGNLFGRIRRAGKRPVVVTHFDHQDEISTDAVAGMEKLRQWGVQLLNQTVLLKEVNDDAAELAATFRKLCQAGNQPYYLFQARPVKGATHFQVPFRRGLEIVQATYQQLSGLEKTFRFIMSHATGKIEILDLDQAQQLYLRYHQCKDARRIGRIFTRLYREGACWLEELPETLKTT